MEKSPERLRIIEKISEYEEKGLWNLDVEEDPVSYPLMPEDIDYLNKSFIKRIKK